MNRLAGEPGAYLRQHADNPVHWQPYDDAAFAEAVARDVPIFLSIGYAACHWCHGRGILRGPWDCRVVEQRFCLHQGGP